MNQSAGQVVLIVDDEPDICYLLGGMLRQRNLDPFFANTLIDAEKVLKNKNPTLLFLDNHLPDGFGIEFIPFIKKNFPSVKVIMMTAHDSLTDRKRAFAEGADLFLSKPLSKDVITTALNSLT